MANIFKTTLKKDIIADIANNNMREIRFPITKFWATRFTDEFNLDEKTFTFKTFDALELSSPSNKDTISETFVFEFVKIYVDDEEFVVEFKDCGGQDDVVIDNNSSVFNERNLNLIEITKDIKFEVEEVTEDEVDIDGSDVDVTEDECIYNEEYIFKSIQQWYDDEMILDMICDNKNVFATNAKQILILPKGRVFGINKSLPLNNDNEVRFDFDKQLKVYFPINDEHDNVDIFDLFKNQILENVTEICNSNFLFIWKKYTGIFMENDGEIYFGMKYTSKKTIGFNRRYNVQ
jgi:hypothetical protein